MTHTWRFFAISGCLAVCCCSLAIAETQDLDGPDRIGLTAENPRGEIQLDGKLDEQAWSSTRNAVELVQQSPQPGEPTPYRTTVKVLVTRDNLYFGFDCEDPDPSRLAIHTMQRDGSLRGDDSVAIVLDPYGDGRTGYYFQINAAGARVDGLISGPESSSSDWDGIWNASTARTPKSWTAEIVIPSRTLSFTRGLNAWGLNLERSIARDQIVLRWASPILDSFLNDMGRTGILSGIGLLEQGWGLEVSPYGIMRMKAFFNEDLAISNEERRVWEGDPGLDVTYRITPQLAAVLTANTDFAETEVDSRQLNITRFPLFSRSGGLFFSRGQTSLSLAWGLITISFLFSAVGWGFSEVSKYPFWLELNSMAGPGAGISAYWMFKPAIPGMCQQLTFLQGVYPMIFPKTSESAPS